MDSRQPPPNAPPSYAFVTRMYRRNLRPVVITVAALGALWTLFSGVGFFRNVSVYNNNGAGKLGVFSIIVGALYMGAFVIELFGIYAASSQKVPLVRSYAFLSAVAALIVSAVGLIQIVIHFTQKSLIIGTCTNLNTGDTVLVYAGLFGPVRTDRLTGEDAQFWCNRAWNRDSWSTIVSFLIISALAIFFSILAFSYLHQLLDPSSPANVTREPVSHRWRTEYPSYYNPPYNPQYPQQGAYPAPSGPPPGTRWQEDYVPPYPGKPAGMPDPEDRKDGDGGYGWAETAPPPGINNNTRP